MVEEVAKLQLVIDEKHCPNSKKQKQIISRLCKKFKVNMKTTKFSSGSVYLDEDNKIKLVLNISTINNDPIMAVLENFQYALGNIMVYNRSIEYATKTK